jgi:hypothetical protein
MTDTVPPRELITFLEACDALGMHRNTGYSLRRERRFPVPVVLIGTRYFVRQRQLDKFLYGPRDPFANGKEGDGRIPCPHCRRTFIRLDLHTRASHPETDE